MLSISVGHEHGAHLGHLLESGPLLAGGLAGSGQMLTQSVAAAMAVNSQWFAPSTATGLEHFIVAYFSITHPKTHLDVLQRQQQ